MYQEQQRGVGGGGGLSLGTLTIAKGYHSLYRITNVLSGVEYGHRGIFVVTQQSIKLSKINK